MISVVIPVHRVSYYHSVILMSSNIMIMHIHDTNKNGVTEYFVTMFCGPSSLVPSKVATDAAC